MKATLVALLLATLTACGSEADIPSIEDEIASGVEDQTNLRGVTIECPDQVDWQAGGEFHCFAEGRGGRSFRVTVSMENDDGEWSWQVG